MSRPAKQDGRPKCLRPACKNVATTRGLCATCGKQAKFLVQTKLTTWEQLETAGRCRPLGVRKASQDARDWLLEGRTPGEPTAHEVHERAAAIKAENRKAGR